MRVLEEKQIVGLPVADHLQLEFFLQPESVSIANAAEPSNL